MFFTLEQKPRFTNCPRCQSTDTFLSVYNNARYCVDCHKLYDRTDEARLREQKMDEALWTVPIGNIPSLSINTH
jgi:transposase-like protein